MAKKIDVFTHNFARNKKIQERVRDFFGKKLTVIRDEREALEQKWLEFFRMWNVQKDENNYYQGRAKLYIPEVRKNVESQARQLTEAAFGNEEDLFDCIPEATGTFDGAEVHKILRMHQIRKAKLRTKYHVYARQACLYGTSPVFVPWRSVRRKIFSSKNVKGKILPTAEFVDIFNGPDFVPADLFRWYPLNHLKTDFEEDGCFYYDFVDNFELTRRDKAGELVDRKIIEEKASSARTKDPLDKYIERAEAADLILEASGGAGEATFRMNADDPSGAYMCTTIYTNLELPEACEGDEDPEMPIPVKIQMYGDGHVGLVRRNPYFHQRAPFLRGLYIQPNPSEVYGQGIPHAIQYMQHEINTKAEQSMDSATLALNPLAFVDPALAANMGDFEVEPGGVWFVNPQGVKLSSIPDTTPVGYQAIGQLRAQMADYSDRSPALPNQLQGKSRSATQSEIVAQSIRIDTDSFHKQNEEMVLEPWLEMAQFLTDQEITEDQLITVVGDKFKQAKKMLIDKKIMMGQYFYQWKSQAIQQNRQIVARQVIDFFKIVAVMPPEDKMKLSFRQDIAARMLWRDLLMLPNGSKVFGMAEIEKSDPEVEVKMMKMGSDIRVQAGDDDALHLRVHDAQLQDPKLSDQQKEELLQHMATHEKAFKLKIELHQKAQIMQQQQMAAQREAQGGKSQGSGNRTQLSPNASGGDMASGVRA